MWQRTSNRMKPPILQKMLAKAYGIEESIIMEGMFVSVGDGSGDLYCLGVGKHFLVKFQLKFLPQGIEHDLISMARVDLLTFSGHSGSKRLKIQGDGREQIYQLCDCCDKDSIFQNFTHCLKTHKSGQQWMEEAVRLQRCVCLPNVLPSYIVCDQAYQAVKATKNERWCIKEMKNQHRSVAVLPATLG